MFSENPLTSLALVLAILAYVAAVRLALRQRLGQELRKMKMPRKFREPNLEDWDSLFDHAQGHARALMWLMPADIIFIGVAIMLLLEQKPLHGSPAHAIDYGIICGALWLAGLHVLQWCASRKASKDQELPKRAEDTTQEATDKEKAAQVKQAAGKLRFCHPCLFYFAIAVPLALLLGLYFWPTSDKEPPKDAEAHYQLGRALYDQGRFEAAIARQRRAIRIDENIARYHYALARALARKGAEYSPLEPLENAIRLKPLLGPKARRESAFESIRYDRPLHKLISRPSTDGGRAATASSRPSANGNGSPAESGVRAIDGSVPTTDGGGPSAESGGSTAEGSVSPAEGGGRSAEGG